MGTLKTSDIGVSLIKKWEGYRDTAYQCAAGVWTIGYGHTDGVLPGMVINRDVADRYLREDILEAEKAVNRYMPIYRFNQYQFDALVSFTFNCGTGNLDRLTKKGTRTIAQIATHLPAYNKVNGKPLQGLINRRAEELRLFNTAVSSSFYPRYTGSSFAIDDVFKEIGATSDYDLSATRAYLRRKPIALANGISGYKGTAAQNLRLINLAKTGELRRV